MDKTIYERLETHLGDIVAEAMQQDAVGQFMIHCEQASSIGEISDIVCHELNKTRKTAPRTHALLDCAIDIDLALATNKIDFARLDFSPIILHMLLNPEN